MSEPTTRVRQRPSRKNACATCHRLYLVTRDVRLFHDGIEHPHCKTCHQVTDNSLNLKVRF